MSHGKYIKLEGSYVKCHNQHHGSADKNDHFLILLHNNSEFITIHMLSIVSSLGRHSNAFIKHM